MIETPPRAQRIAQLSELYAEPLAAAATDLLLRFKEVLRDQSAQYLSPSTPSGEYFTYKRHSTIYRCAALLGWIRALDRDLYLLGPHQHETNAPLLEAIDLFSSSLADGPSLEFLRAARLCEVWCLPSFPEGGGETPNPQSVRDAIDFDVALRTHFPGVNASDALSLIEVLMKRDSDALMSLFRDLAFELARIRGVAPPSPNHVQDTIEDAARALAFREAYIYREWQRAIGDLMLKDTQPLSVISFAEFEALLSAPEARTEPWTRRLFDLFQGVDLSAPADYDSRPRQLRRLSEATAEIVLALARLSRSKSMLSKETIALAKSLAPGVTRAS